MKNIKLVSVTFLPNQVHWDNSLKYNDSVVLSFIHKSKDFCIKIVKEVNLRYERKSVLDYLNVFGFGLPLVEHRKKYLLEVLYPEIFEIKEEPFVNRASMLFDMLWYHKEKFYMNQEEKLKKESERAIMDLLFDIEEKEKEFEELVNKELDSVNKKD